MKKRLLIVLGIGLLTLLTATGLFYFRPEALYSKAPVSGSARNTPIWTPQDIPLWTLVRGEELIYDVTYSGRGHFPGPDNQGFQVELIGTLHILVLSEETDGYRVWLSIRPEGSPQLSQIPAPLRSSLVKGWMEGTGARLATRGFLLRPEISSDTDGTLSQFWHSLGERMQVVLPASLSTPTWDQQESMAGGRALVRYEIDPASLSPALFAEKIYIQKSFYAAPLQQKKINGESLILMRPHFEGLEQLQADTREVQELNGQSFSSDTVLKLHLQKRITQNEALVASLEARWGQSQEEGESSQEASIQKVALGSLGLDDLWGQMHQPGTQSSQELYLKLKAWIYLHPLEIRRLMERLKALDESDPALKMTIRALAASGQPEAQKALVELLDQRHDDVPLARKIITTLGFLPDPTREAQETLERYSRAPEDSPVRRSSRLALGMMSQRLSQVQNLEAQKRAEHLEALAFQSLGQAEGVGATTEALAVLGNSGVRRIEDLEPWLTHSDPAIRGQAFFALRFAKPLNTPDYLVLHYPMEASAEVRRQILQAISLRTPDDVWFQALRKLAGQPLPDDDKITLAKSLVGTVRKYREPSLKILAQLLEQTQDAAVRESLAKYQETAEKRVVL